MRDRSKSILTKIRLQKGLVQGALSITSVTNEDGKTRMAIDLLLAGTGTVDEQVLFDLRPLATDGFQVHSTAMPPPRMRNVRCLLYFFNRWQHLYLYLYGVNTTPLMGPDFVAPATVLVLVLEQVPVR